MAEQGKRRIVLIINTTSSGRSKLCDVIRRTSHDCVSGGIVGCSKRVLFLDVAQPGSNLYRRSSQMKEGYSALLPLTATQAKCINFDFGRKPLFRDLLFRAVAMKTVHLDLFVHVIKKWLNENVKAMHTKHKKNFVVQHLQNRRFVFIDTLCLFTRWICAVRTTIFESLRIWKKFLRIYERFRKKLLLHLANNIKYLWNDFGREGVRRESGGQLIPAF